MQGLVLKGANDGTDAYGAFDGAAHKIEKQLRRYMRRLKDRNQSEALATADSFRSEEHTSELQSLMRISYAVFCVKTKKKIIPHTPQNLHTPQQATTHPEQYAISLPLY